MTKPRGRVLGWLLLAAALTPATVAAQPGWSSYPAVLSPCETTLVDAGRPEARWALGEGVYKNERDRRGHHYAWTSRRWQARLLLASGGERTLRLTGRRGPPQLDLRAYWNGTDLGIREVADGYATMVWTVPATATRAGPNELRFEASDARRVERELSFRLDRIELEPGAPPCGPVETATAGRAFALAPGAILLASLRPSPRAELVLELASESGGSLHLGLHRHGKAQRQMEIADIGTRRQERIEIDNLLSDELAVVSRGPGTTTLRLLEVSGDETASAWWIACEMWWKDPLALVGLLALLALAVSVGRRWPGGGGGLALDCGLLLALALLLRLAYLAAYPDIDPNRFGDSWEYLKRSRDLLRGAPFWSDTSWHAWQTWIRPPGYYIFLAVRQSLVGGHLPLLAQIQAVLLAATTVAGYLVAYPLFGRGAALATGLLIALYPQTITSASWILSDPLALFLSTTALAGLAWLSVRPRWPLAFATGAVFGIGCLVRSAPLTFVPLAALLLYLGQRAPRRKAPAIALAGAALLVVLPWCVRNSMIYGKPMGIDDLVIPNFLMAHPDPEILPAELEESGVWGEADERREVYFRDLWRANKGARMTLDSGRILGRGLVRMATTPGITMRRFALHLKIYFQGFPRAYSAHFLGENRGCRVSLWTDALNLIYYLTLLLALPGVILALRRPSCWPLLAWILFFVVITNLFFYPSYMPGRYRLPIYPAMAAFAGLTLSRAGDHLAAWLSRRRAQRVDA